jgi:urease accessory protein
LWLFPLALAVGGVLALAVPALPRVDAINVVSLILLGVLVASARQLPGVVLMSLVVVFGVTHGYGNGTALTVGMRKLMFLSGMILSGFFVMVYGLIITASLLSKGPAWFAIVVRVLGSWGAAIGLLVLAVTRKALFP